MALISLGSDGRSDQIASGDIAKRPQGTPGLIRHVTSIHELSVDPGSTVEFWDSTTSTWQQLSTYFDVEGIEIVTFAYNKASIYRPIPPMPGRDVAAELTVPAGFDHFFSISTAGVENFSGIVDPLWSVNSLQQSLKVTSTDPWVDVGYNSVQYSPFVESYGQADKRSISANGSYISDDYNNETTFEVQMNLDATQSMNGGHIFAKTTDINLAVLAWRSSK